MLSPIAEYLTLKPEETVLRASRTCARIDHLTCLYHARKLALALGLRFEGLQEIRVAVHSSGGGSRVGAAGLYPESPTPLN